MTTEPQPSKNDQADNGNNNSPCDGDAEYWQHVGFLYQRVQLERYRMKMLDNDAAQRCDALRAQVAGGKLTVRNSITGETARIAVGYNGFLTDPDQVSTHVAVTNIQRSSANTPSVLSSTIWPIDQLA